MTWLDFGIENIITEYKKMEPVLYLGNTSILILIPVSSVTYSALLDLRPFNTTQVLTEPV